MDDGMNDGWVNDGWVGGWTDGGMMDGRMKSWMMRGGLMDVQVDVMDGWRDEAALRMLQPLWVVRAARWPSPSPAPACLARGRS